MAKKAQQGAEAQMAFRGTVRKLGAVVKGLELPPDTDQKKMCIVHVDEILNGPEMLKMYEGQDVSVQVPSGKLAVGQQRVFHANGWLFGSSLGLQAVSHEAVAPQPLAAARGGAVEPQQAMTQRQIAERADSADVVVSGMVTSVGVPGEAVMAEASTGVSGEPISEHTPFWREAVVEIHQVHKGSTKKKNVVIRFPSSTDVRWFKAPKFQAGQEGLFMLHEDKEKVSGTAPLGMAAMAAADQLAPATYTCLNPVDFQPAHHADEVAMAVKAAGGDSA